MQLKKASYSLCLLLAACAEAPRSCPVPKQWTRQEQLQIVEEREQLPSDSILLGVLDDWERMRRELK